MGNVAGTAVEVVQKTDYPWNGAVAITVNPEQAKTFSIYVRIPNRTTSKLYTDLPAIRGMRRFAVNGNEVKPEIQKGYTVVTREWKAGDRIELDLPMDPQRVLADPRISADDGLVALKRGPLVYNMEMADNRSIQQKIGDEPLKTEWRPDLLGGTVVITGKWADGTELVAIPNYARMNRVGPPRAYPGDEAIDSVTGSAVSMKSAQRATPAISSKVWI